MTGHCHGVPSGSAGGEQRIKNLQDKVDSQNRRQGQWDDLMALCEMGNEFEDESLIPEKSKGDFPLHFSQNTGTIEKRGQTP